MKTSILAALSTIAVLATPALAGKHKPAPAPKKAPLAKHGLAAIAASDDSDLVKAKTEKVDLDFGEGFVMKHESAQRETERPDVDEETFEAKGVSNKAAIALVKSKSDELEYCWMKLPAAKRANTSASLHIAIEASGAVAGAWVDGSVPASVEKCLSERAAKWTFPAADAGSEIEHALSFSTLESKGQ
ncbi:MAG TPA: hypothetical protein VGM90_37220 [Kofleriaceae bacterium]|jgi:hypothetical protein